MSIGGFVPKPHTPFQWVGQLGHEATDARLAKLRDAIRSDRKYAKAIGFRYHDGKPGIVEGLLSRGDRRVGKVIKAVYDDGGRFDGWSEHFSFTRWMKAAEEALADEPVDVDWYTTRDRENNEVLPWDHLDSGLDRDWLWEDWQDALTETEVDDCRWTPCFDCGVCPQMGTEIQAGPTGQTLLPVTVLNSDRERILATAPSGVTDQHDAFHERGRRAVLAHEEIWEAPPSRARRAGACRSCSGPMTVPHNASPRSRRRCRPSRAGHWQTGGLGSAHLDRPRAGALPRPGAARRPRQRYGAVARAGADRRRPHRGSR